MDPTASYDSLYADWLRRGEQVKVLETALQIIAAWSEGRYVTGGFDEPHAARVARKAMGATGIPEDPRYSAPLSGVSVVESAPDAGDLLAENARLRAELDRRAEGGDAMSRWLDEAEAQTDAALRDIATGGAAGAVERFEELGGES